MLINSLLARCRIGCQIAVLGLIGIVAAGTVAGVNFWGAGRIDQSHASESAADQSRDLERNAQIALLQARRHEKDFLLRRDEASVSLQATAVATAEQSLDALANGLADNPAMQALAREMMADTRQYATTFAAVLQRARTIGLNENEGLLGKLRVSVHDVEAKLATINAQAAQIAMLMMRRHEKDFIARLDPKYGAEVAAELPGFIAAVHAADPPAGVTQDLLEKMRSYQETFAAFQAAMIEQASAIQVLSKTYAEIEPRLIEADRRFRALAEAAQQDAESVGKTIYNRILILLCAIITSMILLCWIVGRGIARPIVAVTRAMDALVKGDFDTPIPTDKRRDEIGTMIHVIGVLKESMLEAAQMRAEREAAREISEQEKSAALVAMAERIEADSGDAVGQISKHTTAMTETVERMHALAANTGQSATSAATAAEAALVTAQTVASAAEQLSASVREISVQVAQSTVVVNHAVGAGQNARETIQTLNERVGRIGAVATIIADIAARTNLLALNATIEAARAGDAGKGFAVVAGEVKQLANQTAQSTREITRHVNDVRAATEAAVSAVHGIETTIDEVNQIAGSIASAVEEQGAATAEIARNVAGTAQAINEMTSLNMGVSSEAKQAGEYAKDVLEKTKLMGTSIRELQQTVIRTVRQSAAEVNRRLQLRYETDLPCRLETAGTATADARIADISEGGARVIVARDIPRGTSGTLFVPAMNATLPFQVEASRPNEARLLFPHDEETKTVVLSMISRLPGKLAA